mmetsp:Transcript_17899/g.51940  ORF Transcript_17899/g.51940 Transcript_17899/m.51940 type:complete len:239 (-) Transcript_17899:717-1433(-)
MEGRAQWIIINLGATVFPVSKASTVNSTGTRPAILPAMVTCPTPSPWKSAETITGACTVPLASPPTGATALRQIRPSMRALNASTRRPRSASRLLPPLANTPAAAGTPGGGGKRRARRHYRPFARTEGGAVTSSTKACPTPDATVLLRTRGPIASTSRGRSRQTRTRVTTAAPLHSSRRHRPWFPPPLRARARARARVLLQMVTMRKARRERQWYPRKLLVLRRTPLLRRITRSSTTY